MHWETQAVRAGRFETHNGLTGTAALDDAERRNPHPIQVCGGRSELERHHREARRSAVRAALGLFPQATGSPSAADRPAASAPGVATCFASAALATVPSPAADGEIENKKK